MSDSEPNQQWLGAWAVRDAERACEPDDDEDSPRLAGAGLLRVLRVVVPRARPAPWSEGAAALGAAVDEPSALGGGAAISAGVQRWSV